MAEEWNFTTAGSDAFRSQIDKSYDTQGFLKLFHVIDFKLEGYKSDAMSHMLTQR